MSADGKNPDLQNFFADNTFWSFFIGFYKTISYNIDIRETWISKTGQENRYLLINHRIPYYRRK